MSFNIQIPKLKLIWVSRVSNKKQRTFRFKKKWKQKKLSIGGFLEKFEPLFFQKVPPPNSWFRFRINYSAFCRLYFLKRFKRRIEKKFFINFQKKKVGINLFPKKFSYKAFYEKKIYILFKKKFFSKILIFFIQEPDKKFSILNHIFDLNSVKTVYRELTKKKDCLDRGKSLSKNRKDREELGLVEKGFSRSLGWVEDFRKFPHSFFPGLDRFDLFSEISGGFKLFHKNFRFLPFFQMVEQNGHYTSFFEKKSLNFQNFSFFSFFSKGLNRIIEEETIDIMNLRGFLNRLTLEKSDSPYLDSFGLRQFKYLISEILEKIRSDHQFLRAYVKILVNHLGKIKKKSEKKKNFLKNFFMKKFKEKNEINKCLEYCFRTENRFIFLKNCGIHLSDSLWTVWNNNQKKSFYLDSYLEAHFHLGFSGNSSFLPIKSIFSVLKKSIYIFREIDIDQIYQILEFFLKKQIKFNGVFLKNLIKKNFKKVINNISSSRLVFLLEKIERELWGDKELP